MRNMFDVLFLWYLLSARVVLCSADSYLEDVTKTTALAQNETQISNFVVGYNTALPAYESDWLTKRDRKLSGKPLFSFLFTQLECRKGFFSDRLNSNLVGAITTGKNKPCPFTFVDTKHGGKKEKVEFSRVGIATSEIHNGEIKSSKSIKYLKSILDNKEVDSITFECWFRWRKLSRTKRESYVVAEIGEETLATVSRHGASSFYVDYTPSIKEFSVYNAKNDFLYTFKHARTLENDKPYHLACLIKASVETECYLNGLLLKASRQQFEQNRKSNISMISDGWNSEHVLRVGTSIASNIHEFRNIKPFSAEILSLFMYEGVTDIITLFNAGPPVSYPLITSSNVVIKEDELFSIPFPEIFDEIKAPFEVRLLSVLKHMPSFTTYTEAKLFRNHVEITLPIVEAVVWRFNDTLKIKPPEDIYTLASSDTRCDEPYFAITLIVAVKRICGLQHCPYSNQSIGMCILASNDSPRSIFMHQDLSFGEKVSIELRGYDVDDHSTPLKPAQEAKYGILGNSKVEVFVVKTKGKLFKFDEKSRSCEKTHIQTLITTIQGVNGTGRLCYQPPAPIKKIKYPILRDQILYKVVDRMGAVGETSALNLTIKIPPVFPCAGPSCEISTREDETATFDIPYRGGWPGVHPRITILDGPRYGEIFRSVDTDRILPIHYGEELSNRTISYRPSTDYFNVNEDGTGSNALGIPFYECITGLTFKACPDSLNYLVHYENEDTEGYKSNIGTIYFWVIAVVENKIELEFSDSVELGLLESTPLTSVTEALVDNKDMDTYAVSLHILPVNLAVRMNVNGSDDIEKESMALKVLHAVRVGKPCILANCFGPIEFHGCPSVLNQVLKSLVITAYKLQLGSGKAALNLTIVYNNVTYTQKRVNLSRLLFTKPDNTVNLSSVYVLSIPLTGILISILGLHALSRKNPEHSIKAPDINK